MYYHLQSISCRAFFISSHILFCLYLNLYFLQCNSDDRKCASNADCCSGVCEPPTKGKWGKCVPCAGIPDGTAGCTEDGTAGCTEDADCCGSSVGFTCTDGVCCLPGQSSGCSTNKDCCSWHENSGNFCLTLGSNPTGSCSIFAPAP